MRGLTNLEWRILNSYVNILATEGDTVADFHEQISTAVRLGFKNFSMRERSESGPPGPASFAETVDHYFSIILGGVECPVVAGELMARGIIRPPRWGIEIPGNIELRLGRELRGSANHVLILGYLLIRL